MLSLSKDTRTSITEALVETNRLANLANSAEKPCGGPVGNERFTAPGDCFAYKWRNQ